MLFISLGHPIHPKNVVSMRKFLLIIILIRFQSNSFHNTCFHNNIARSFCFTLPHTACLKHINWENCQWILYCVLKREPLKHKNLNYSFIGDNQPPETLNLGVFRDLLNFYANISALTSFCPHFIRNCLFAPTLLEIVFLPPL